MNRAAISGVDDSDRVEHDSCDQARLKIDRIGHDQLVPVSLFDYQPQHCPFGHQLWPGMAQVGWKPCICTPAQEANARGRGMGHLWVSCNTCHDQLWQVTFYQPPHDIRHHQPGPWWSRRDR